MAKVDEDDAEKVCEGKLGRRCNEAHIQERAGSLTAAVIGIITGPSFSDQNQQEW